MKMKSFHAAVVVAAALLSGCATLAGRQPLPIADVVDMSKSGAPPAQVIQRVRQSATTYALRGSDYAKLKAAGVPDPVLDYLQQSFVGHLDLLTRYWVLGERLGGCRFCYPQPVDVDRLQSGFGVVDSAPAGYHTFGKPPGAPDWLPAGLPRPLHRLTPEQIVKDANSGRSDEELVKRIRQQSRLDPVIGVGGWDAVRTQPVAGLSGSTLAQMHERGVSHAVLDAVQTQFLAQFIEVERLRYQNWGKAPGSQL
jgi:hypothetical protein